MFYIYLNRRVFVMMKYDWLYTIYSRLSLSRIPRDSMKYFEISVPRHIRFAESRKNNSNNHI